MADKRIFQLDDEGFLDDLTDKVYMWLDKKANEGEPDEPSWKFKANVFLKILNNFATKFVPNVLTVEGKCYWHDGELFVCDVAYTGDWVPGNFTATSIDALFARKDVVSALQEAMTSAQSDITALQTKTGNISSSIAPEFVPNSTTTVAGLPYMYNGTLYVAKEAYQGPWNSSKFTLISSSDLFTKVAPNVIYNNLSTNPTSLNNLKDNCTYIVYRTANTTTIDFPSGSSNYGILSVTKSYYTDTYFLVDQIYKQDDGIEYYRQYNSNGDTWTAWKNWTEDKVSVQKNAIYGSWASNLSDLNDAPVNSVIVITARTANTTTANFPSDFGLGAGVLFTYKTFISSTNYTIVQILKSFSNGQIFERTYTYVSGSGSWGEWLMCGGIVPQKRQIFNNWSYNLASLDDAPKNSLIIIQRTSNTTTTGFPSDFGYTTGTLDTIYAEFNGGYQVQQKLTRKADCSVWVRTYTYLNSSGTGSWDNWVLCSISLNVQKNAIHDSWASNLSDLNDAPINSVIVITARTANTTTANFPSDFGTGSGSLETIKAYFNGSSSYVVKQKLTKNGGFDVWLRTYTYLNGSGSWSAWAKQNLPTNEFHIGSGQEYTTLRAGITAAYQFKGAKVIIHPGTYDLIAECSDVLDGTALTANFTPCPLGNDMHVICMDGVKVSAMLEKGELSDAVFNSYKEHFEPMAFKFNGNNGDFIVENLNIESKNTRYCVHDDVGGTLKPYVHKYINCHMYRTNSNLTAGNNFTQCIGGGLGKFGTIVIDGGTYQSAPVVAMADKIQGGDLDYQQVAISYHNSNVADTVSTITLKDVYFVDKGYFESQNYGPSEKMVEMYISGCRMYYPPMNKNLPKNMEFKALWNNEIVQDGEWVDADDNYINFVPSN